MRRIVVAALSAVCLHAAWARAQAGNPQPYPEVRVDALVGQPRALQLGAGAVFPLGNYARLGAIAGGGVARDSGATVGSARADVMMRFLLDPFRQQRWGISAGGGVSVRYEKGAGWRPFLTVVLDLEGPKKGLFSPAFQLGLGGGARIGVVLRASGNR